MTNDLASLLDLAPHGCDVYVGEGSSYPWGGLYGGHIVAQALRAAAHSVEDGLLPHSLRAYFIRRGDNSEPVRYELDRIRNGRSFATRRVVARQSVGAILNLEASFQRAEESADIQTVAFPQGLPASGVLPATSWTDLFDRRPIPETSLVASAGAGRVAAWMKVAGDLGEDQLLQRCALAYLSDDLPTEAVVRSWPDAKKLIDSGQWPFNASLDHTVWFHRPLRADRWHLHDLSCHGLVSGRGLAIGHVFSEEGVHVATVAQEALVRLPR
ncbi:MAG TPA: acyl-CoA thioesterase domain-containing protein [Candidatus Limnocylindrales bacterium]|nr:acyl-CoA thioesterase domain-containing protein [Candidatus Limnocylindrales bacterium]